MSELKPCPFCGGRADLYESDPDNIPNRYRNSAFRYVDSSNFEHCKRWENVAARKKQEKEQKNEDNVL